MNFEIYWVHYLLLGANGGILQKPFSIVEFALNFLIDIYKKQISRYICITFFSKKNMRDTVCMYIFISYTITDSHKQELHKCNLKFLSFSGSLNSFQLQITKKKAH